jgi:uncharacterized protein YeaO (DUF488 family)
MPTVRIKRVYDPLEKSDGFRILVDRLWPRGIKKEKAAIDLWEKEIAPSKELRKWFNHDPKKWVEFQKRYAKELAEKQELLTFFKMKIKQEKTVTLLFAAKEVEHNNAIALKKILSCKN